ncbi:septation protein SepH [Kutzneria sp. CA-103260]|uniref:septation protein SepH n=1 Tax=Kutzneria sp. CA-103260 TaxID=2802641 RepID=UPI001BA97A23|nr:septation protein SepH [Kutzneria sp. CA-103260]QUQ69444.1 DNA-binding protein [Kutzneria sp. CA-103260]
MRALRVVGLDDDGTSVICEDPVRGERYTIPCDERLRAAARGDVARLGQIAAETDVQMRPREIQARIRAGESVEQVAAAAGLPTHRVERFAYPVLLERSRTAELAQRAHPIREDGPDVQTLGEVIAHSFGLRGQDYTAVNWDSWRGEDGKWIIQLHWQAGRSENRAHWTFHPGAHGGTVSPIDDHAIDLLDPSPNRPLRTVRPVTELARQALELEHQAPAAPVPAQAVTPPPVAPEPTPEPPAPVMPEPETARVEPTVPTPAPAPAITDPEPVEEPPAAQAPEPAPKQPEAQPAARKAEAPPRRGKKNHPIVPSWEDVLLGVRSQR